MRAAPRRSVSAAVRLATASTIAVLFLACGRDSQSPPVGEASPESESLSREIGLPAAPDALAPSLTVDGDAVLASWLEALPDEQGGKLHRLMFARWTPGGWSEPTVIAQHNRFFANWADIPGIVVTTGGDILAHWLAKTGTDTYAYSIFIARSTDGGRTWTELGSLNDDDTPTEHGFVSWVSEGSGARAFWLDGREMLEDRPMALRTAWVGDTIGPSEVLDERVCECCSTDAAVVASGPLVVFRDRGEDEVRDVGIVRRSGEGWSRPQIVHSDGWEIPGCPVNGPGIAASGQTAVVSWYTGAGEKPRVQVARSRNAGEGFAAPVTIDEGRPIGRVDVILAPEGDAIVSWLEAVDSRAEIRLRRVMADGALGPAVSAGKTAATRASGFPKMVRLGQKLYLAYVVPDESSGGQLHFVEIPLSAIPTAPDA